MRVAYLAENSGAVARPWAIDGDALMRQTGLNVGNLAFWYAARLLIDADLHFVGWNTKASEVPADVAALVIPAANFINETNDLSRLAELVRDLDRPVFLLGIGAQAETEDRPPNVKPGVTEFLNEVSRRTPKICVRGDFTAKVCEGLGVGNTAVLGCPSILINPQPDLGRVLSQRIAKIADGPLAIHASCVKHNLQSVERELVRYARLNAGSAYVVQRPVEFIKAAHGEVLANGEADYYRKSADFLGFGGDVRALTSFLRASLYAPTSVDSWLHFLRRFSASLNTRIHGTLMSVNAGLPGICINHDTRTRELSQRLMVPRLEIRDFLETRYSVREMFARSSFDAEAFDQNRAQIAAAYRGVVEAIGLRPSRHLLALANGHTEALRPVAAAA